MKSDGAKSEEHRAGDSAKQADLAKSQVGSQLGIIQARRGKAGKSMPGVRDEQNRVRNEIQSDKWTSDKRDKRDRRDRRDRSDRSDKVQTEGQALLALLALIP